MKPDSLYNNKWGLYKSYMENYNDFPRYTLGISLYEVYLRHDHGPSELLDLLQNQSKRNPN